MDMPWVTVGTVMGVCRHGRNRLDQSEDAQSARAAARGNPHARDALRRVHRRVRATARGRFSAYAREARDVAAGVCPAQSHPDVRIARGACRGRTSPRPHHGPVLLEQPLGAGALPARAFGRDGSIEGVWRGLPRGAQVDPRRAGNQASAAALGQCPLYVHGAHRSPTKRRRFADHSRAAVSYADSRSISTREDTMSPQLSGPWHVSSRMAALGSQPLAHSRV